MLKFTTRSKARVFAQKTGRKVVDLHAATVYSYEKSVSRWGVQVVS